MQKENTLIKRSSTLGNKNRLEAFLKGPWPFIIPTIIVLLVLRAYPFFWQFWLSLTNMRGGVAGTEFIGLSNFSFIFSSPAFLDSIFYTAIFLVTVVGGQMFLGIVLALLLEDDYPGKNFFRVTFLIPGIVSGFIIGILWQIMLVETNAGLLNAWLAQLGIGPIAWLSEPSNARIMVIIAYIWKGVGFSLLLVSGGLKTVPKEFLEAAEIDGASYFQKVFMIKLPMIRDIISINLIFNLISTLNAFETILLLTNGGPARATSVIALNMYNTAFGITGLGNFGRASAIGVVLFFITLIFVVIYIRQMGFAGGGKKNR